MQSSLVCMLGKCTSTYTLITDSGKTEQAIQNQGKTEELNQMLRAQTSGLQSASTQLDKREMARILYEYKQLHYAVHPLHSGVNIVLVACG